MSANIINSGPPPLKKAKTDGSTPSILAFFGKKAPVAPATESELPSFASRAHTAAEAVSPNWSLPLVKGWTLHWPQLKLLFMLSVAREGHQERHPTTLRSLQGAPGQNTEKIPTVGYTRLQQLEGGSASAGQT